MNNAMNRVEIPAKPEIKLSWEVYDYLVWIVPKGKLTTDEAIREFLSKTLNCGCIDFELPVIKYSTVKGFAEGLAQLVPRHRIVSKQGYIVNPLSADKIREEGLELEEPKGNRGHKVKNYKKFFFHYEDVECLDAEFILRIQKEGIEHFIPMDLDT